jgi:putative tryptophan/tyrosine transport system substrate-binding protein
LWDRRHGPGADIALLAAIESAAAKLAIEVSQNPVANPTAIKATMENLSRGLGGGLLLLPDTFLIAHREMIVEWAASYRLPAVYPIGEFTAAGGLMSYGVDLEDINRRAAAYAPSGLSLFQFPAEILRAPRRRRD